MNMNIAHSKNICCIVCVCHARNSDTTLDRTGTTKLFWGQYKMFDLEVHTSFAYFEIEIVLLIRHTSNQAQ